MKCYPEGLNLYKHKKTVVYPKPNPYPTPDPWDIEDIKDIEDNDNRKKGRYLGRSAYMDQSFGRFNAESLFFKF